MVFPIAGGTQDTGYEISNSLSFNEPDGAHLSRTPSSAGNRKTWTFSCWIKRSGLSAQIGDYQAFFTAGSGNNRDEFFFDQSTTDTLAWYGNYGGTAYGVRTSSLFRDVSAWYHIVWVGDTTQGTEANRLKLYVNGTQETLSEFNGGYLSQNTDMYFNNTTEHEIGSYTGETQHLAGYMSEINHIDGQALDPTYFAETNNNGVWIPKKYTGSYGTNGFFMEFKQTGTSANSSGMGADTSGNDHHFTPSNLAATDVTTDTPTNNFATLNPLNIRQGIGTTFQEGNCQVKSATSGSSTAGAFSTIAGLKSGKWYAEFKPTVVGTNATMRFGIESTDFNAADGLCNVAASAYASNGNKGRNATDTSHGDSYDDNDIIGVAVDLDNGAIYFSKNGTWQNSSDPESGSSKTGAAYTDILTILPDGGYMFAFNFVYNNSQQEIIQANFGNPVFSISSGNADANGYGNFEYAVPSGYYSLCTKNLAEYG